MVAGVQRWHGLEVFDGVWRAWWGAVARRKGGMRHGRECGWPKSCCLVFRRCCHTGNLVRSGRFGDGTTGCEWFGAPHRALAREGGISVHKASKGEETGAREWPATKQCRGGARGGSFQGCLALHLAQPPSLLPLFPSSPLPPSLPPNQHSTASVLQSPTTTLVRIPSRDDTAVRLYL